jgi:hypothetical protein
MILWTYFAACNVRRIFPLSRVSMLWRTQYRQHIFLPVTYSNSRNSERALLVILNAFAFYYSQIEFECWPGNLNSEWIYSGISLIIPAKYQTGALLLSTISFLEIYPVQQSKALILSSHLVLNNVLSLHDVTKQN